MRRSGAHAGLATVLALLVVACTSHRTLTHTPRTGIEQLLVAVAAERTAGRLGGPDLRDASVYLDVTGLTPDAGFGKETVAVELQKRGARIVTDSAQATHIVKILVKALGTDQTETFFGLPAMTAVLFPIPEIALFKRQRQVGRSRLHVSVIDARTGELLGTAEEVDATTSFIRLTILPLVLEWTDLSDPVTPDAHTPANRG